MNLHRSCKLIVLCWSLWFGLGIDQVHARAPHDATETQAERTAEVNETSPLLRRMGESCFFGAGAGAASTLLSSLHMAGQGLSVSTTFGVAIGAAGLGCLVGFAGASAAGVFISWWEQDDEWLFPRVISPPAATASDAADLVRSGGRP